MTTVTLKLPAELKARLKLLATRRKSSTSEVARKALEQYLESGPELSEGSVLDLTRDLVGSLDGPRDLSMARKHLKRYGR